VTHTHTHSCPPPTSEGNLKEELSSFSTKKKQKKQAMCAAMLNREEIEIEAVDVTSASGRDVADLALHHSTINKLMEFKGATTSLLSLALARSLARAGARARSLSLSLALSLSLSL